MTEFEREWEEREREIDFLRDMRDFDQFLKEEREERMSEDYVAPGLGFYIILAFILWKMIF